jgi:hypothetical protein
MGRSDFVSSFNHLNLFSVTYTAQIRANSLPMQCAFRDICLEPGFQEHLEATLKRIREIESLGRTREIVAKGGVLGVKNGLTSNFGDRGSGTGMTALGLSSS